MCQFTSLLTEHFDAVGTGGYDSVFKQIILLVYQSYTLEVKPVSCWNMINLHCVKMQHISAHTAANRFEATQMQSKELK